VEDLFKEFNIKNCSHIIFHGHIAQWLASTASLTMEIDIPMGTVWSKPWLFFHLPSTPLNSFQTSLCVCDNVLKLHLINGVVLLYQIYVGGKDSVPKNKGKSHLQLDMIMNSCALVAESKQGWRCRAYWDGHNWSSICGQGLHLHQQSEKFMMRGYIIPMSNVLEKDKKKIGTGSS
jgi:hypothetical protein